MSTNRFTDGSGFEEVPSQLEEALTLVPSYQETSKEEEPNDESYKL